MIEPHFPKQGGVNNLHGMPGLISGIASAIVAASLQAEDFGSYDRLFTFYPARVPPVNSAQYLSLNLAGTQWAAGGPGRSASQQGGFQVAGIALTLAMAVVGGCIVGVILRLPFLEQVPDDERLFEDEPNWIGPPEQPEEVILVKLAAPAVQYVQQGHYGPALREGSFGDVQMSF